jgi:sentrin-specific protease 1
LFSYSRVFIPVHVHGNHWCLGCLSMSTRRIEYLDSLAGDNPQFFSTMRAYLEDEWAAHHPLAPPLELGAWSDSRPSALPRQYNGSDCGVFTLKFADYLSLQAAGCALPFTADDMEYFRHRIALEISLQRVL